MFHELLANRNNLQRMMWLGRLKYLKRYAHLDTNLGDPKPSLVTLDIIIPALDKDLDVLPLTVQALRANLRHPIGKIYIVSPASSAGIKHFCIEHACSFVDEAEVAPIKKSAISYKPGGTDRSGWILQQLIKLSADAFATSENILLFDADTLLIRPHIFMRGQKPIFDHSDEQHRPYYETYKKLTGQAVKIPLSFVAHHMVVTASALADLRAYIEKRSGLPWHEAIISNLDPHEGSSFSEYELYGNFYCSILRQSCVHEYWFNLSLPQSKLKEAQDLSQHLGRRIKSLSFHSYNK